MTQVEVLLWTLDVLDELGVPYMLTGALAVNFYGRPRMTHDIDIVVHVRREHVSRIVERFDPDFYVAKEGIEDAIVHRSMFNAIHHESGLKVDMWQVSDSGYDKQRFERRVPREVFGRQIWLPTAEDVIVTKLDWYRQARHEKHLDDAVGVWKVQRGELDLGYVETSCRELGLTDLLETARAAAED